MVYDPDEWGHNEPTNWLEEVELFFGARWPFLLSAALTVGLAIGASL